MQMIVRPYVLVVMLVLGLGNVSSSRGVAQEPVQPTPLAADHPLAKQAAALVTQILVGDRDAVLKTLRAQGTPALAQRADLEQAVDTQLERLANKGYKIEEFLTGRSADVIVELRTSTDATNIVVRFTTETPHKIEGFAFARMGG